MEVWPVAGMTHREEVTQPVSFSRWPRECAQALLESTCFSLTEFSYDFMFSSSLFLFYLPPHSSVSPSSSSPASGGQGRGAAPCELDAGAADRLAGMLREQHDLFPFPGEARHITSAMCSTSADPRLGMTPAKTRAPGLRLCQEAKPRMCCG